MSDLFLYNYRRCPFCIRVRMALLWKGIGFDSNEENLSDRSIDLKKYYGNKRPTVPLLIVDEKPIFESLDIMHYLEDNYSTNPLSKKDFLKWGNWSALEFRDAVQLYKYSSGEEKGDGQKRGVDGVMDGFRKLESSLDPYLCGSELGLADFAVWPFVRQALRVTPKLVEMGPKLTKWFLEIENQECFKELMSKKPKL